MERTLNELERRVIGVLIEKALSQPDYYPMTSNAIVAACNQRSNRHPVLNLDETAVLGTLEGLRRRGLVSMVLPPPGARMNRYKHEVEAGFGWGKRQQAIMAELLLRGPQTPGELRSRCARMFNFESLEAVMIALGSLSEDESGPGVVAEMLREPGQSAVRYQHLLCPESEVPTPAAVAPARVSAAPAAAPPGNELEVLRSEMNELRGEVAALREEVADLRRRIEFLKTNKPDG